MIKIANTCIFAIFILRLPATLSALTWIRFSHGNLKTPMYYVSRMHATAVPSRSVQQLNVGI